MKYIDLLKKNRDFGEKNHHVNDIEYEGEFTGAGVYRDNKVPATWPNAKD